MNHGFTKTVQKAGDGMNVPRRGKRVTVHYTGTLTNNDGTAGNFSTLSFNNGGSNTAYITTKHNRNGNNDGDRNYQVIR